MDSFDINEIKKKKKVNKKKKAYDNNLIKCSKSAIRYLKGHFEEKHFLSKVKSVLCSYSDVTPYVLTNGCDAF